MWRCAQSKDMAFRPTDGSLYLSCSKVVGCITPRTVEGGARRTARVASSAPAAACVASGGTESLTRCAGRQNTTTRGEESPNRRLGKPSQLKRLLEKFGALCWEIALFHGSRQQPLRPARPLDRVLTRSCSRSSSVLERIAHGRRSSAYSPRTVSDGIHPTACRRAEQRGRGLQYGRE